MSSYCEDGVSISRQDLFLIATTNSMIAKFIKSAADSRGWPENNSPEVGMVGRSNAGKSSIINKLAGQKNLARVSQAPGKTALLNFYQMDRYTLVDMPGYGYASRGKSERDAWTPMIEEYLQNRENLKGVVLVMDIQRDWSVDERNLVSWLDQNGVPVVVALNKADKLNQKEMAERKRAMKSIRDVRGIVYTSAEKKTGIDDLNRMIFDTFLKEGL